MARPQPFVRAGQELRFVQRLRRMGKWPLPEERHWPKDPRRPVFSPYIVLQTATGDNGGRPLPDHQVLYNQSVQILDSAGNSVTIPEKNKTYTLVCRIINLGNLGAFGGMVEFHLAPPATVDALAVMSKPLRPAWGYEGFTARPGEVVTVKSRRPWTPATDQEAMSSIVVHAHDPFNDPIKRRFDARHDRHVGRHDTIPDFDGTWKGTLTGHPLTPGTFNIRLEISQAYQNLTAIKIYFVQVPPNTLPQNMPLPATPQATVSATVVAGVAGFTAAAGTIVGTISHWHLARQGANALNVVLSYPRDFIADGVLTR